MILYLNNCDCGRKHCNENAAYVVKSHLKKVTLKDVAMDFMIEYVPFFHLCYSLFASVFTLLMIAYFICYNQFNCPVL